MQPIEKALNIVITQGVADNYVYPIGEMLSDDFGIGNTFRNPYYGQTPSAVKFMCGNQEELDVWLIQTKDKYPVIWLVYPITERSNNDASDFYTYPKTRLVFATNNEVDKLVQTRIQTTRFVLDQLTAKFKSLMRNSSFRKFISMDKVGTNDENFRPNYSADGKQTKSGTVDVWDTITLDCDLHLISGCIPKN